MKDRSEEVWNKIAKLGREAFRKCMSAAYDERTNFYPHTELLYLDSSKKYKILDFGCGDGRNASYLRKYAHTLHGYDLEGVIPKAVGYDKLTCSLADLDSDYDIVVCAFTFQFFYSKEYLNYIIEKLSSISPFIYVIGRIYMEDGSNVFNLLFENKNISLEIGDGQNLGMLSAQTAPSNIHFEQIYKSRKVTSNITPHIGFDDKQQGTWIYKSYNDAILDIKKWSKTLPNISGVAGVPRSGVALAGVLSHQLNIKYYSIESLFHGTYFKSNNCRPVDEKDGPILVLDDTCWSGYALSEIKRKLANSPFQIKYGALYVSEHAKESNLIDFHYKVLPSVNHTFEWNLLRDPLSQKYMVDMDGVLCEDWTHTAEMEDDEIYIEHLSKCTPLYKPLFPLYKVVTARLEKYRRYTEEWLHEHGVVYNELIMSPYSSRQEREQNMGFGHWKAEHYKNDEFAVCFVESDVYSAEVIYQKTGKPVFCIDNMKAYGSTEV